MLLGAAKYLAETRNFSGCAVLIFQPSEEVPAEGSPDANSSGGAAAMLDDRLMERFGIGRVFGMHNMPGLPVGQFAIRPGGIMAATDFFDITIEGRGAHASMPQLSCDPVYIGCQLGVALQSIVARNVDPLESAVVSLTVFNGSTAKNMIPNSVRLGGTVRTFSSAVQAHVISRIETMLRALEAQHGARITLDYQRLCPLTVNSAAETALAARVAAGVAGTVDAETRPVMGGEDFSYMLRERPGAFIFIGNGDSAGLHHPAYEFDDNAIPAGVSYWARLVETALPL
jgi:amidohydrolase